KSYNADKNISWIKYLFISAKKHLVSISIWIVALASILIYGFVSPVDYSNDKAVQVALIQQNSDPWVGGVKTYKKDLNTLIRLSDEAIKNNPEVDFVVWPETAFVPRIEWHYKHRYDREKFEIVEKLLNFIDNSSVPFVFGNDHGIDGYTSDGQYGVIDYNAVLLFRPEVNVIPPEPEVYSKMKLVPFTEYFPFDKVFPKLYKLLLNGDTHMWEPGLEPVVFDIDGLKFGTPICFEDTFGFVGRKFVNAGANAFVNLSNDAWSKSLACQYQHLSMAVFRSVENRVPSVRATTTGQTAVIDPNGKILAMAEPFIETYLIGNIPVRENMSKTIYTKYGDYVGVFFAILSVALFIAGFAIRVIKKKK
ncbi:MAG: apolipoprotein N-acyltransferase, partial [Spirochaetaceae bacterium]|nr:apolipoprotein N-acyltransferase [Spirochaetaceae bacterium]